MSRERVKDAYYRLTDFQLQLRRDLYELSKLVAPFLLDEEDFDPKSVDLPSLIRTTEKIDYACQWIMYFIRTINGDAEELISKQKKETE
ncbi:hypothetical protein QP246_02330 [Aerococcus urinae]|uniref:hypothetical protein n=1 Tax=Aerococcus urinae TaxID=1376 RepID=UPI00254F559B|nr:hypothetical protein [Aerococcus urinae]MDK6688296.1 hypothetical protein [Aerococcus urinae]